MHEFTIPSWIFPQEQRWTPYFQDPMGSCQTVHTHCNKHLCVKHYTCTGITASCIFKKQSVLFQIINYNGQLYSERNMLVSYTSELNMEHLTITLIPVSCLLNSTGQLYTSLKFLSCSRLWISICFEISSTFLPSKAEIIW